MHTSARRLRRAVAAVAAVTVVAGLAACSPDDGASSSGDKTILNVAGQADNLTKVFNPYFESSALGIGAKGMINEVLVQVNYVSVGDDVPWLAKTWEWSDGNKTFTVHLQEGVKWSDGQAFSSDDVVFSYELMKKFPALNLLGIDFATITATDANTVVFTFDKPSEQNFTKIVGLPIVAKHQWESVEDPTTFEDSDPIGTGPFTLGEFSPQSYTLEKNPNYWQTGKPEIDGLRFIAYKDNTAQANALVQGDIDWAGTFIANADKTFTSKSDDYHYWRPAVGVDGLIPNHDVFPFTDLEVLKAISLGTDRDAVAAASGDIPATSQIGLPMPAFENEIAAPYKGLNYTYDVAGAKKILEADGWAMGSDGYYAKDGKQLAFSITFPGAYTDIAARAQVLVTQMKDIGINVTLDTVAVDDINNLTSNGNFESTIGYPIDTSPRAYLYYDNIMNPAHYVPVGTANTTYQNIQRFQDPEAAELFKQYETAETDDERGAIMEKLEGIWIEKLPMISMFYWSYYGDWSTKHATGFPDEDNAYFAPNPNPVVAVQLKPVK